MSQHVLEGYMMNGLSAPFCMVIQANNPHGPLQAESPQPQAVTQYEQQHKCMLLLMVAASFRGASAEMECRYVSSDSGGTSLWEAVTQWASLAQAKLRFQAVSRARNGRRGNYLIDGKGGVTGYGAIFPAAPFECSWSLNIMQRNNCTGACTHWTLVEAFFSWGLMSDWFWLFLTVFRQVVGQQSTRTMRDSACKDATHSSPFQPMCCRLHPHLRCSRSFEQNENRKRTEHSGLFPLVLAIALDNYQLTVLNTVWKDLQAGAPRTSELGHEEGFPVRSQPSKLDL
uniref:Predicted protein n=1 Tax=Physcomitrium patens TaxID=3218 RepID=A9U3Y8_PHYPA